ncbi:hypothetical protein Naga_101320g2, partial [Nannochloropsis gaditana]
MLFLTKLLRAGAFAVSVLAYSYLELIDLSGLAPGNGIESGHGTENGKGGDFLTASMGAAGITLPPASVMSMYLTYLPIFVVPLLFLGLCVGGSFQGMNAVLHHTLLVLAAVRPSPSLPLFLLFLASAAGYWASGGVASEQSDKVAFRPYESEIRQLLLRHDPAQLHRVDSLLEGYQWRGGGKRLLQVPPLPPFFLLPSLPPPPSHLVCAPPQPVFFPPSALASI